MMDRARFIVKHCIALSIILIQLFSTSAAFCEPPDTQILEKLRQNGVNDDADAEFNLGHMYFSGWGVKQNYMKAMEWYKRASDNGSAKAQNAIGVLYEYGLGVDKDSAEASAWYKKACNNGLLRGCENLQKLNQEGHSRKE
ncbi:MAG: sel1 repeat family protein [Chlorobium sp.]|nr:MAG: sel1 repeat family protein [Chlorobium sp.]